MSEFLLLRDAKFEPLGLVMGSSIHRIGFATLGSLGTRELTQLSHAMYRARELAMARLEAEAAELKADGIVGVRLTVRLRAFGKHSAEFLAVGTAVRATEGNWRRPDGRPFTSDLNGQDFWKLRMAGFAPIALTMGVCVYHVAALLNPGGVSLASQELPAYTQAAYAARELAMARMQAEAERDNATGVVGVQVREANHVWGRRSIEFLALGTSIRPQPTGEGPPSPSLIFDLSR